MKIGIYARVSTAEQDEELQLAELRRFAAARHWEVFGEFLDRGISGAQADRPAWNQLLSAARRRDLEVILVWRFDRFSRSIADLVASLEEFRSLGVGFISIHEQIDTTSPTGRVVFAVIAAMAEFEREILRERVRAGLARARERGIALGRPRSLDAKRILRLRQEGFSIRAISREVRSPTSSVADLLRREGVRKTPSVAGGSRR